MPIEKNLTEARCQKDSCKSLLARLKLEGGSLVEIKCRRCNAVSTFIPDEPAGSIPDGQGGYTVK